MELHGVSNDSWVLSPVSFSGNKTLKHPEYSKPSTRTFSLNSRASTDTFSSFSPLSNSLMFATPSPTAKSRKSHRSFFKAMKQFLTCYNPVRSNPKSKQKSSSEENSVEASKTSSIHAARASPDYAYSTMNSEERDENLKAVITYCNKSRKSERRNDTMVSDCVRNGRRASSGS